MSTDPQPSDAELAILQVLWDDQPCSVKHVHEVLSGRRKVASTTTLKLMQRLYEKQLVVREAGPGKSHLYSAAVAEGEAKGRLVDRFVRTAFDNSVGQLVLHALGTAKPTDSELDEIRKLLDELDKS